MVAETPPTNTVVALSLLPILVPVITMLSPPAVLPRDGKMLEMTGASIPKVYAELGWPEVVTIMDTSRAYHETMVTTIVS
jgi:hypothetical protein